jgi:hypothetical protein
MHKATPSNSHDGGLFSRKGSIFGGGSRRPSTRPGTSSGSTTTTSDSNGDTVASQDSTASSTPSTAPRKTSFSSSSRPILNTRKPSFELANFSFSPEKRAEPTRSRSAKVQPNSRSGQRRQSISHTSGDISAQLPPAHAASSHRASVSSTAPYSNMLAASMVRNAQDYRPDASYQAVRFNSAAMVPGMIPPMAGPQSPTLENITFQHIQDMASKRISTLDYLRKAYDPLSYIDLPKN